jgi:hypothetical protein
VLRFSGTVYYTDGRTEAFSAGMGAQVAWELYAQRNGFPVTGEGVPPALSNLVIAHAATRSPDGFETWRATVDGADVKAEDVDPPTGAPLPA